MKWLEDIRYRLKQLEASAKSMENAAQIWERRLYDSGITCITSSGRHNWGKWTSPEMKEPMTQMRICGDCSIVQKRTITPDSRL